MRLDRICGQCGCEFSIMLSVKEIENGDAKKIPCINCGETNTIPTIDRPCEDYKTWED